MRTQNRYAHARACHLHFRQVQDLAPFVLHLHLLGGVAVFAGRTDLGNEVEGNLIGEGFRNKRLALRVSAHLRLQFCQSARARTGHGLIGGGGNGLDGRKLLQGVDGHQRDNRRAVGVGDDAVVLLRVLRVDLRHHQRHAVVEAEGAGIVYKHRPRGLNVRGHALGQVVRGRAEHDIHALKGIFRSFFHRMPVQHLAGAAGAGKQLKLADGELALHQHLVHLASHRAGRAENRHIILLHENITSR